MSHRFHSHLIVSVTHPQQKEKKEEKRKKLFQVAEMLVGAFFKVDTHQKKDEVVDCACAGKEKGSSLQGVW